MSPRADESRARELLRQSVDAEDYESYVELGFISVPGGGGRHAYLVYPYRPLVAYATAGGELLAEYCVRFEDGQARLPPADDVLAKWLALRGGEHELVRRANLDPPGHQVDPEHARRDLARLAEWRARRALDSAAG